MLGHIDVCRFCIGNYIMFLKFDVRRVEQCPVG